MRNLVFSIFMTLLLIGCGVETDSSTRGAGNTPVDTNQTDTNTTVPVDTNTTVPKDDLGEPTADQAKSDFDTRSAIKDQNACVINGTYKNSIDDSSFDPTGTIDELNGVTIASSYRYNADIAKTIAVLYYPNLDKQNGKIGTQANLREENYRISYDVIWGGNSVKDVYVRTPRDLESKYYGCVRYTLAVNEKSIVKQRVYRVNE